MPRGVGDTHEVLSRADRCNQPTLGLQPVASRGTPMGPPARQSNEQPDQGETRRNELSRGSVLFARGSQIIDAFVRTRFEDGRNVGVSQRS